VAEKQQMAPVDKGMSLTAIQRDIATVTGRLDFRILDYWHKYNWFLQNNYRRQHSLRQLYTYPTGYYSYGGAATEGRLPAINLGRNIALTIQSKLIQSKGRIFFNGVNSLFKTLQLIRKAQIFFDAFIDSDKLTKKVAQSVLDALVFNYGVIYTDDETNSNTRIQPWNFYYDQAEINYGKLSRAFIREEQYPLFALKDKLDKVKTPWSWAALEKDPHAKVTRTIYFDMLNKQKVILVNNEEISRTKIDYDRVPFAIFYYNDPIKGGYSTSVMDNVLPNQGQIDNILIRVSEALQFAAAHTTYVPYVGNPNGTPGSGPNGGYADAERIAKVISNRVGNVVLVPANGTPVVATPSPISPEYLSHLRFFIDVTYETEGVSKLSATGRKPSGVTAGVALDTLQDIESERFQATLDNLIQFYKDIYNNMIDVFPKEATILPERLARGKAKWGEIKASRDSFSMETSLASVLSKDPQKKAEQLEKLASQGLIPPETMASLLDIPDLNRADWSASASSDYCWKVIEDAIEKDQYDYYNVLNMTQCLRMAVNTLCQMAAADDDTGKIQNLIKLIRKLSESINTSQQIQNPPMDGPKPPPSDMALDGSQVSGLKEILKGIKEGLYTPVTARAMVQLSFPSVLPPVVDALFAEYQLQPLTAPAAVPQEAPIPVV
jgi:hypothetical protein